jgi:restriction system protein
MNKTEEEAAILVTTPQEIESEGTPEEALDRSYHRMRAALSGELLETVKKGSPRFFEGLVLQLLLAMGYGKPESRQLVGRSGDEGVDGVIHQDKLGLKAVYIQAKKWADTVGRPVVQAFAGSLQGQRARKGVFITTSGFSQEARDYVRRIDTKIVLIDGSRLAELMMDHNVGVSVARDYVVKKMDLDFFEAQ